MSKHSRKHLFFLTSVAITLTGLGVVANKAEAQSQSTVGCPHCGNTSDQTCFYVDSRNGWQYYNLGRPYTRVASVSGGWSVDARNYSQVGPRGHLEPGLEPYNQYKYDKGVPFGALFVDIPTDGYGYVWVQGSQQLPKPITRTAMRINDADNALGDNAGVLRVCFSR
ncbi:MULTISPECIES: hypothetical protein [unclassified Nostoc]|uniref:hypothetical protein n=1 Tax=unclassified Nostoc TaxID=2593658 RepID=UPI002AD3EB46|nr:hypothetical protein [Nostoc sp. DedQUE03]MDZ7976030.1 hypothetical protein [Nostoc sp. DedQUE03]MDZ8044860.1 hypothetical protein [Nostoc sp. DedQUE02]